MTIVSVEAHIQDSFICECDVFNAHLTTNACRVVFPPFVLRVGSARGWSCWRCEEADPVGPE